MKKVSLTVDGMHCKSCEVVLTESLQELPGVGDIKVSQKQGTVTLLLDESQSLDVVKAIIEKEGYKVK